MTEKQISINKIALKILEEIQNWQIKCGEKKTYEQLLDYTKKIIKIVQDKQLSYDVNELTETLSGNLLDSIGESNSIYFIEGMKAGATIITQLLI